MTILKNAAEAIQIGLEDFKSDDQRRAQSAIRNIFAGTLLLFKEKLRRMSPEKSDEVLLKQKISPVLNDSGEVVFQGSGSKTVDVQQITERFKALNIFVDWKTLKEINDLRNNIEHYYSTESPFVINEVVAKSFKIIRDFCITYLDEEPSSLLGQQSWEIFLQADEIYEKEKEQSQESLLKVDWSFPTLYEAVEYLRCPLCASDLIHSMDNNKYVPGEDLMLGCKKCSNEFNFADVVEQCIEEQLLTEAHIAAMDGGDGPYTDCPECGKDTFVFAEECCLACGYKQDESSCAVCGKNLDVHEAYDGALCSYHRWIKEKADIDD